jgi:hypothetical protein
VDISVTVGMMLLLGIWVLILITVIDIHVLRWRGALIWRRANLVY